MSASTTDRKIRWSRHWMPLEQLRERPRHSVRFQSPFPIPRQITPPPQERVIAPDPFAVPNLSGYPIPLTGGA